MQTGAICGMKLCRCRHSRVGGNPARNKSLRSRTTSNSFLINALDSRLRGNDGTGIDEVENAGAVIGRSWD
jgi:hypothetical protein